MKKPLLLFTALLISITALHAQVTFAPQQAYAAGSTPYSVAVGDINSDGKPDIVVANYGSSTVSVLLGNGGGTFAAQTPFATGSAPYSVALGDINGDGKADIVTANYGTNNGSILLGKGDGTFVAQTPFATGNAPYSVALGDINSDGNPDIVVANATSSNVSVLLGNGDGTFAAQTPFATGSQPTSVALGDINGDSKPDIVTANRGNSNVSVLLGNGDGTFAAQATYATGSNPYSVAVGDINGDGKPDIVTANYGSSNVSVLMGNGSGTFAAQTTFATGSSPSSVALGDINGDGKPDIVTAHIPSSGSVLLGNGDGTFAAPATFATGSNPFSVTVGDITGDSKPDIVTANSGSNNVSVLLNMPVTRYVKANVIGGTHNGTSWTDAYTDLQTAINASVAGDSVFVAGGTYLPKYRADNMSDADANDRSNAFVLKKDVKIYGGFKGDETDLADRDLTLTANASILSGDLGTAIVNTDNAFHVVISAGAVGNAELNGFTIKDGNANGDFPFGRITVNSTIINSFSGGGMYNDGSSPIINNVIITSNNVTQDGGGMYNNNSSSPVITHVNFIGNKGFRGAGINNSSSSSPVITNVTLSANTTDYAGGGIFNISSSNPKLTNVIISGNTAVNHGGGIYNATNSSPVLTNVTITGNTADLDGGGIFNYNLCSPVIRNSIIYGNNTGIFNSDGTSIPAISYSLVQGLTADATNLDGATDPLFVSAPLFGSAPFTTGDYSLQATSPVINKGNNTYFDASQTPDLHLILTDLAGNTRKQKGTVDMGAYESAYNSLPATATGGIVYVSETGAGTFTGDSWTNATNDLQEAINVTGVQQVWVAGGTYFPNRKADALTVITPNNRDNAFVLKAGVKIYGGFKGDETLLANRNLTLTTNASILSGDLGTLNNNADNAYHVVISAGALGTAELNGFTIKDGNANVSLETIMVNTKNVHKNYGGGMYNISSSSVITNVTISGNNADNNGGGIYNISSSPTLTHVSISGNKATNSGGGIYNTYSSPTLTHVSISGNTANSGSGGGIIDITSSPTLTNVTISGNTAGYAGGGMYNITSSSPTLTNVTITGNNAAYGGGMYNITASAPMIRNSIIYGNNTGIFNSDGTSIPAISYSLVQGLTADATNLDGATDPLFVSAPLFSTAPFTTGDYSLQATSQAINKGNNAYYDAGQTPNLHLTLTDLAGNTRIYGGVIDMGAYENQLVVLPVSLLNFTAKANGNQALLQWQTASEQNNSTFVVYRSGDDGLFAPISERAGVGTSTTAHSYSFYDASPLNGTNYYRLVQVDNDGKETDLGLRQVSFELSALSLQLYPNPTVGAVYAQFEAGAYQSAALLNTTGAVLNKKAINKDDTLLDFDLSALPAGVYIIKLNGEKESNSRQVLKK